MQSAAYFRNEADRCRRMARSITNQSDPIIARLLLLAEEHDAKALEADTAAIANTPKSSA